MMPIDDVILGVDPGHRKCGVASVARGAVLARAVAAPEALEEVCRAAVANTNLRCIVVGDGTCSVEVAGRLAACFPEIPVARRDETGTSLLGRARYWLEHPPRGLWKLVPTSLRLPPVPVDDWAAAILAERMWRELEGT